MPRPPRIHYEGALFHVMTRGNDKQDIYLDDNDRIAFLERMRRIKNETGFSLYAYCLMTNHFHLLVRVRHISISAIMHRLLSGHCHQFNRKWNKEGHLFGGRYKAIHCAKDNYFKELVRYINLNPVSAGLVSQPGQWRWSGYKEMFDEQGFGLVDRDFVLALFGGKAEVDAFISRAEDSGEMPPGKVEQVEDCFQLSLAAFQPKKLEIIASEIAAKHGLSLPALLGRSRMGPLAIGRKEFILRAAKEGYRISDLARYLQRSDAVISRLVTAENAKFGGNAKPGT
jgi:REP element-mobilizing transposase RayT